MRFPITSGDLARLLQTTEPRLGEAVRRGRVSPPPEVIAGRRHWTRQQALQVAAAIGELTDDIRTTLEDAEETSNCASSGAGRGQP